MKKSTGTTQFFHQNNKLVTLKIDNQTCQIIRTEDIPHAEQANEKSNLLATDHNGSVLKADSAAGTQAYSAYGQLSTKTSLLGFNGEYLNPLTNSYFLGNNRTFYPSLMRFTSPDSLSPFGAGGINSYMYCEADPINNIDPTGHSIWKGILNLFGREDKIISKLVKHNKSIQRTDQAKIKVLGDDRGNLSEEYNVKNIGKLNQKANNAALDRQEANKKYLGPTPLVSGKTRTFAEKYNIPIATPDPALAVDYMQFTQNQKTIRGINAHIEPSIPIQESSRIRKVEPGNPIAGRSGLSWFGTSNYRNGANR